MISLGSGGGGVSVFVGSLSGGSVRSGSGGSTRGGSGGRRG